MKKKAIGKTKAVTNKGKATTAATAGIPKRATMNRRKYDEAISGDTMSSYAMYKKGGTTKVKKYQAGKQVATKDSTSIYAEKARQALKNMSPNKPGSEAAYEKAQQDRMDYENRKNKTNYKLPGRKKGGSFPDLTGDGKVTQADILKGRGVFKKGGTIKKKK